MIVTPVIGPFVQVISVTSSCSQSSNDEAGSWTQLGKTVS
jgi:hypothetical protein